MPELIHWAAAYGETEYLKEIIANEPGLINKVNRHGMTPLHAAAFHGQVFCVKLLLNAGADPNIPSAGAKFTFPLHLAVTRLQNEIAELLLVEGRADACLKDYLGQTPLDIARNLSVENDSLAQDEDEKQALIRTLLECISKVHASSLRPFTFVSGNRKRTRSRPEIFFNETDLPSPLSHSVDFFKSETAIESL